MENPGKKKANATKRLLAGIVLVIIGLALIKFSSILAWIIIIIGVVLVFAEVANVEKINKFLDEIEKEIKIEDIVNPIKKKVKKK